MDDGVLETLSGILAMLEEEGDLRDYAPLIQFFRKGFSAQAVQSWSYYAEVNNHAKFASSTEILTTTLKFLGAQKNVYEYGSTLIDTIITNQINVLYRGLNTMRASTTISTIVLMKEMILFSSGSHVEQLISNFDFSLPSLAKILNIGKTEKPVTEGGSRSSKVIMRQELIDFWLLLTSLSSPILRKGLLTENPKIMGAWFRFMDKADSVSIMKQTLDTLVQKVLTEPVFKRLTKTKILNELALSKIHSFYYSSDRELVKKVNEFFLLYGSDPKASVVFPDDRVWFSESPLSGTRKGAVVAINQKEFHVYNKLLFNVLKFFKPWEDDMQSITVCKILNHVPELVAPYCAFLASHGSHDPKMTSYWFGCTMTIGRIINLEIPAFMKEVQTDISPSTTLVMQNLVPSSLTKMALTKALHHEKPLIRQLACQLIVFSFYKLEKVFGLYEKKGWVAAKASLRNAFHAVIPEPTTIVQIINQTYADNKENKILQLSLTTILRLYSKIFSNFFSVSFPTSNIFADIIGGKEFSGMDLAILDNFLRFQELNGTQMKWWQKTPGGHSLFVSLLTLTIKANDAISDKICQVIENMFRGTVIFNDLSCSPQKALVHSLQAFIGVDDSDDMSKIWKLLDEAVERCMRTPYKYVDSSREHRFLSPFTMALSEQWNYVDKSSSLDVVGKWFCIYLRTMIICGESEEGTKSVIEKLSTVPREYTVSYLAFDKYEEKLERLRTSDYMLANLSASSFFEYVTLKPYSDLKKLSRYPTNRFDAAALQFRLTVLVNQVSIDFDDHFRNVIDGFLNRLANYSMADISFKFMNINLIDTLFENISHLHTGESHFSKSIFVANEMIQMNRDLFDDSSFKAFAYSWLLKNEKVLRNHDQSIVVFVSSLCRCLRSDHSLSLLELYDGISPDVLKTLLRNLLEVGEECVPFAALINCLKDKATDSIDLASLLIENNRISGMKAVKLLELVFSDRHFIAVIEPFIRSQYYVLEDILPYLTNAMDNNTALRIALAIPGSDSSVINNFLSTTVKHCLDSFEQLDADSSQKALKLFHLKSELLLDSDKAEILDYIFKSYKDKYSATVIDFVILAADFERPEVANWLAKLSLFITRAFTSHINVSELLLTVLSRMQSLLKMVDIWEKVPGTILCSQLEAILNGMHVGNSHVLEYVCHILLAANGEVPEFPKLLQCFITNEQNILNVKGDSYSQFLSSAIIFILFSQDPSKCCTAATQRKFLEFYSGTPASHDRILFKVLEILESVSSSSWTNEVYMWDLLENENEDGVEFVDLISSKKEGLIVTLRSEAIENTTKNYILDKPKLPPLEPSNSEKSWENLQRYFINNERALSGHNTLIYDPMFLLLASIHNEELLKKSVAEDGSAKYVFNVKGFLDCGMLQLAICALSDEPTVHEVALNIIMGLLNSLEEKDQLKDNSIFKVLLKRIVFTLNNKSDEEINKDHQIAPCIWLSISNLCYQLLNPASNLFEKSYRWVFSSPFIRYNDIPLLQELMLITNPQNTELEHYYRQLGWVLDTLNLGIKTNDDVDLLKRKGVLEWLSNLMNIPYLNARLSSFIHSIFYLVQRIENGGSTLITRTASISNLELHHVSLKNKLQSLLNELSENEQDNKHMKRALISKASRLNVEELLEGHAILVNSQKRLKDWVDSDFCNIQKRLRQ